MSESATHDAIEAVARDSYGRLVAYIASRTGDIADAQDALSEALVAALENWPTNGVPDKPEAWLLHVVKALNTVNCDVMVNPSPRARRPESVSLRHYRRARHGNVSRPLAAPLGCAGNAAF